MAYLIDGNWKVFLDGNELHSVHKVTKHSEINDVESVIIEFYVDRCEYDYEKREITLKQLSK